MSKKSQHVVIIGGGVAGLASAALLAKDGYKVTLYEKNERVGGRANLHTAKGFSFDLGPSWYLMPDVFNRFFAYFDKKPDDLLELKPMEPQYRMFFPDGSSEDISRDPKKTRKIFERLEPGAGKRFDQYLAESKRKYDISMGSVLYKNADTWFDFFSWELLREGKNLNVFQSMESYVNSFFKSEKLRQIIQYTLVFLGGAPSNTPALYSLMTHLDFNEGVFYPMGGFYKVIQAIADVAKKSGAKLITNAPITQIVTEAGRVTGVRVKGKFVAADVVIGNADYVHLEDMLDDQSKRMHSHRYWKKQTLSPSAFLLYLGVKGSLPKLEHHNIYFGENWLEHFDTIFKQPSWPQQPSLYINKPSASDPSVAPKGHENLMILVPIAPGLKETPLWKEQYAQFVIRYIEQNLGIQLEKNIVYQKIFSVTDFASMYNSYQGNALAGTAHTLWQTGPFRAANKHRYLENLFFAGAYTVPGIGVPPALISAELAWDRVKKYRP